MSTVLKHRRRTLLVLVAVAVILGAGALWLLSRSTDDVSSPNTRTVRAGEVEVTMTAQTLDSSGATFRLALDTHAGSLDLDVASATSLRINGNPAGTPTWTGTEPGGHHREGTLRFTTPVPPGALVELRITGLPDDVFGTWTTP